jgi:hypothetical protein
MRRSIATILSLVVAVSAAAETFDVLFDQPALDRWMYPFNGTPGTRATLSVFGSDREVPTQFDARDGQVLLAFDTDLVVPAGGGEGGYAITGAEVTMQVSNDLVFQLDRTIDPWTTFLPATDPRFTPDTDPGQPIELFGVGFRGGWNATSFQESTAFANPGLSFIAPGVRNAFAAEVDAQGVATDVSNGPRQGLQARAFATGSVTGLASGAAVPADSIMRFQLDVADPGVQRYLARGLDAGRLFLAVSSLTIVQQQGGAFPAFHSKESAFVQLGLAQAARLRIQVETGPSCRQMDVDCTGQVDFGDVALVLLDFGPCPGCRTDVDGTGEVDFGDVALVLLDYG